MGCQATGTVDALLEGAGDDGEDAYFLQQAAKAQTEDDDSDRAQHGLHTATTEDIVDEVDAGGDGKGAVGRVHRFHRIHVLEQDGPDQAQQGAEADHREGGLAVGQQAKHQHYRHDSQRSDVELLVEGLHYQIDLLQADVARILHADHSEQHGGNDVREQADGQHPLDVLHYVDVGHGGCQHDGVGERGEFVTEVDAGKHGTGNQRRRYAEAVANPHHGDTGGGGRTPGGTSGQRGQRADDQGRQQEDGRVNHLEAEVDDAGHDAASDPGTDQCTDGDQDQDGPHPLGYPINGGLLQGFVVMTELDAKPHDDEPGDEQCQLDRQIEHTGE